MLFATLAGATYQGAATAIERRKFPHPGRMIDIGGLQLHIYCTGNGAPTVVLEAPAAGMSAAWGWVQPAVAQTTRVCSYDRAGLGWSEAGDQPKVDLAVETARFTICSTLPMVRPNILPTAAPVLRAVLLVLLVTPDAAFFARVIALEAFFACFLVTRATF